MNPHDYMISDRELMFRLRGSIFYKATERQTYYIFLFLLIFSCCNLLTYISYLIQNKKIHCKSTYI